jgi:hypothetical protein
MTTSISSDLKTGGRENNSQSAEKTRQFWTIETNNKVQSTSYSPNDKFNLTFKQFKVNAINRFVMLCFSTKKNQDNKLSLSVNIEIHA